MHRDRNVIGSMVAKLRYQRRWTQDDLVARLQVLGCYMTRDILANLETRRSVATDKQIEFFVEVFGVQIKELFPPRRPRGEGNSNRSIVGLAAPIVTRRSTARRKKDETCPTTPNQPT